MSYYIYVIVKKYESPHGSLTSSIFFFIQNIPTLIVLKL